MHLHILELGFARVLNERGRVRAPLGQHQCVERENHILLGHPVRGRPQVDVSDKACLGAVDRGGRVEVDVEPALPLPSGGVDDGPNDRVAVEVEAARPPSADGCEHAVNDGVEADGGRKFFRRRRRHLPPSHHPAGWR